MPAVPSTTALPTAADRSRSGLVRLAWMALAALLLVTGGLFVWFAARGYPAARVLADGLSKDGSMERFTQAFYAAVRLPLWVIGLLLLAGATGALVFSRRGQAVAGRLFAGILAFLRRLGRDSRDFWRDLLAIPLRWPDWLFIGLLLLAGILLRLLYLSRPMVHDEAYTYLAFASRPWLALISDYHLPNNHIFHSVLVKVATGVFGSHPWAVRFPAFLSGVLCIPAGYLLAFRLYGRWTALLSAGLIATLPVLVMYSTNARGYSQYTLFALLLVILAVYLVNHRNPVAWLLLILVAVLGFYTLPVMVYPLGGVMAWLLISSFTGPGSPAYGSRWNMLKYLLVSGLLVIFLTALLYLPVILIGTGWGSLSGNTFVNPTPPSEFPNLFALRMRETWAEWMIKLPAWLGIVLAAGFLLSLVFHRRISHVRVPLHLVMFAWLALVMLVQRPNPLARLWTFLIPLCVIWAAAGLVETLARLRLPARPAIHGGLLLAVIGLLYLGGAAFTRAHSDYPSWQEAPGQVEKIVQYLQPRVGPADMIVISSSDAPPLWYYSRLYGIPSASYDRLEDTALEFTRAFVVVSLREGQTLQSAIKERSLDPARFDLASAALLVSLDDFQVYTCALR